MQLVLRYDEWYGTYAVHTGDQLTKIAKEQIAAVGGITSRSLTSPRHLCRTFSLGTGLQCQFEFYGEAQPGIARRINETQARLLTYLLSDDCENLVPTASSIYSRAISLATQAGIKDVFGLASALHLVAPAVNGQLRQLADDVEQTLPFVRCTLTTQLALSPALTSQIALLDQARMTASVEVAKIAITTPLDGEEELRLRLAHMEATLGHLSHGEKDLVPKLNLVTKQLGAVVQAIQPEVRQQLRLPERQPSLIGGMFRRFCNFVNKK